MGKTIDSRWVRYRSIGYLKGKGLSFGAGPEPIVPKASLDSGKYSINFDVTKGPGIEAVDSSFDVIAKASLDHIFIGPRLDECPSPTTLLQEATSKLAIGGHLIIHRLKPELFKVDNLALWQAKDSYIRDGQSLAVYKLLGSSQRGVRPMIPPPARRACIARYGAIGDMIILSPLIRKLAEDGYAVTLNITPYCAEVVKNNPYVSNIIIQERDAIPNQDLGEYWKEWMNDYDKYINLSESIEGKLLRVEGRRDFYTSKEWRLQTTGGVNYFDQTLRLGGYSEVLGSTGELYFSRAELKEAAHIRGLYKDKFLILWGLKGSSHHKQYPALQSALSSWLDSHRDAWAILMGAPADAGLQFDHPQVIPAAGQIPLRTSFALTQIADLVVGPESALINSAGCFDTPKICFLSHSNPDNLTKYWANCISLVPDVACAGCMQLHYTQASCPCVTIETGVKEKPTWTGPICAGQGVTPERVWQALDAEYNKWQRKRTQVPAETVEA